ncbi:OmpP1/FadL family transporter [Sunxiuqinia indica]|uniref:OmpP1/FadL family transporter n=1 Tax=Sunxiuqinia indica TaxID=2692584 RepID=UPI00135B5A49|nr:outer membrane protein transport protein [Sunxiuqinia indica]
MKKTRYIFIAMLLMSTMAMGQNLVDGLRYSDNRIQGTARSAAMGNAFGALGGDFTSASINPAGLGVYRSNEFVITSQFGKTAVDATYLGQSASDSKYNFSVPNIGYVASIGNENSLGGSLVGLTFGVGYNRLNNFNMKRMVEADNANSTLLDNFVANANDNNWSNFYEELAWQTFLINEDELGYHNVIDDEGYGQSQRKSFTQKGALDEFILSLAANFNHKFYLGATVGIHNVDFTETTSLHEYGTNNNDVFNEYTFNTYLNTTGTGFNVKLGALYKPIDALRLGVAIHTPTFYRLHDSFDNSMYSSLNFEEGQYSALSPLGDYDYDLETPMKAVFSAAYIIGKSGILSVDYEYVDYSTIKLSDGGNSYDFFDENQEIQNVYKSVGNLRIGAEYRLSGEFSLRGGYEYRPSPINSSYQPGFSDPKYSSFSGGLGYRQGNFFLDAAYKHALDDNYAEVYTGSDLANYEITKDQFILTLGFKF